MDTTRPHILIVADRSAPNPTLAAAVRRRAAAGACRFTLLVPAVAHGLHRVVDPEDACCAEAERTAAALLPSIEAAAGQPVAACIGAHEALAAIEDALNDGDFSEVIVATANASSWRWLRADLSRKVGALGVTVTTVSTRARTWRRVAA